MRVLLITADASLAQPLELCLKSEGIQVFTTDLGEEGVDLAKHYDYQAVLLGAEIEDMTPLEVVRHLRAAKVATPIMVLGRDVDVGFKVRLLGAGADDVANGPLHRDELVARLYALARRAEGHFQSVIEVGLLSVDISAKVARVRGRPVHLTGREYALLEILALRAGITLTKEVLMNHLYGGMDEPEIKIVDVFMCKVRKKLTAAGAPKCIATEWGRGYRLVDPNEGVAPAVDPVPAQAAAA